MEFEDDLNEEWLKYLNVSDSIPVMKDTTKPIVKEKRIDRNITPPECSPIVISTKTKIVYLNTGIDLFERFWDIPMISYDSFQEGVIKKQIRFNFQNKEEVEIFEERIKQQTFPTVVRILNKIDNPNGRVQFKDIRKVDVGISKNDLIKSKKKDKGDTKSAFYNCFVFIYRIKFDGIFKEVHVKLFNSGKFEIPGIQDESIVDIIVKCVLDLLQPHYGDIVLQEKRDMRETILINSNFKCNYYINREELFNILKTKYNIKCSYDPCSYPGIQCKYKLPNIYVSFMIFRTGSVLFVGKCNDEQLFMIYEFIKQIFYDEINSIYENDTEEQPKKNKKKIKRVIQIHSVAE
jgi:TATA-box binding protein (TBP) (component of TFIID and TFIIIB)